MDVNEFHEWLVEVDVQKTRAFYSTRPTWSETCECTYCKNFVMVCHYERLPKWLSSLLQSLGIDPSRDEGEIWQYVDNEKGTHSYGGFYHVVGRILKENPNFQEWSAGDNIHIKFTNKLDLISQGFPRPAIQVEFLANIPWLLPEEPAN